MYAIRSYYAAAATETPKEPTAWFPSAVQDATFSRPVAEPRKTKARGAKIYAELVGSYNFV